MSTFRTFNFNFALFVFTDGNPFWKKWCITIPQQKRSDQKSLSYSNKTSKILPPFLRKCFFFLSLPFFTERALRWRKRWRVGFMNGNKSYNVYKVIVFNWFSECERFPWKTHVHHVLFASSLTFFSFFTFLWKNTHKSNKIYSICDTFYSNLWHLWSKWFIFNLKLAGLVGWLVVYLSVVCIR